MDVLASSNDVAKNDLSNTNKSNTNQKSTGELFSSILNKVMADEKTNTLKTMASDATDTISPNEATSSFKEDLEQRVDAAVERLAAFFGIGKHLMKAILQSVYIDPKDLLDPSKKEHIVKVLGEKFGLSKKRAEALSDLLDDFRK